MIFPIFNAEKNMLTSLKGEVSYCFKVKTPDLSQLTESQKDSFYERIENSLKTFRDDCYYRFYSWDGNFYLNTNDIEVSIVDCEIIPLDEPLQAFFRGEDLYHDVIFYEDYLIINSNFVRLLNFYELPNFGFENVLTDFGDYVFQVRKIEAIKAKKTLNLRRKLHFSSLHESLRNIESENAFGQSENLYQNIINGEDALFDGEGWVVVSGSCKEELDQKTKILLKNAKLKDMKLLVETDGSAYFYNSIVMGVSPSFKRKHPIPASTLRAFLPIIDEKLMEDGFELHSPSGKKILLSIFHPASTNFNAFITGTSGQGKSMMANKIILEELRNERKIVVLDLGNSFKKNVAYHGGSQFSEKFNPLQFQNPSYLKAFIKSIVSDGFLNLRDEGKIYEFLKDNTFKSMAELIDSLENQFSGIRFYFSELNEFFTDEVQSLDDLTYCDLSLYPEHIKAPLIIYLIEYFKNLQGKKIFLFDECWDLLKNHADYIAECFRTFRKHDASAIAIAQNLDDFVETYLGRVIVQNCFYKLYFRQECETEKYLDKREASIVKEIKSEKGSYSEFLISSEVFSKVVHYIPSLHEYELFNTEKKENIAFQKFLTPRENYMNFPEIFNQYFYLKHPHLFERDGR
ncbi:MAG: VirB4 family type IV secretion system protein [Bacteriovoracaceae bacterium]